MSVRFKHNMHNFQYTPIKGALIQLFVQKFRAVSPISVLYLVFSYIYAE
jgi:Na+/serine symporter